MSNQAFDKILHTPTSIIIPNVKYRGKKEAYEVRRRVLPAKNFKEYLEMTRKARKSGDYGVGDAPLYFALFRALYEKRDDQRQREEIEKARKSLSRKLQESFFPTSTTIDYRRNANVVVTHYFGNGNQQSLEVALIGESVPLSDIPLTEADSICRNIYNVENREEVVSVLHWMTQTGCFLLRYNLNKNYRAVVGFITDFEGTNLGCDWDRSYPYSGIGVRIVPPESLERYQTYRTDFAKTMQKPLLDSFGKSAEIEIDVTETFSAQTPEMYQRKVRIVDALQGREDLSDAEVLAVEEILKKKREEKQ